MELISFFSYKKKTHVSKAVEGDRDAVLALINENRVNIYRVARGILRNEEDIKDAIQNTVIKTLEKIGTLKEEKYFKTWLIRILVNECNDILRRNKKLLPFEEAVDNINDQYTDRYENIDLVNAINSLPKDSRITLTLFYFDDLSIKEVSEILEISEGTVKSRLSRARTQIKKILGGVE